MSKINAVTPYLFFDGRCEEAIEFYGKTLGAEKLMLMRYKDMPPEANQQQCGPPGAENRIMHARLGIGGSTVMLSDGPCSGKYDGFSLSLTFSSPDESAGVFSALAEGGQVDMPLNKTFFSPAFGMLTDRFGVKWMIMVDRAG